MSTPPTYHPLEVSYHSIGQWLDETFWFAVFIFPQFCDKTAVVVIVHNMIYPNLHMNKI
jgi:hypothetical protein